MSNKLIPFQTSYFGMPLGLSALAQSWIHLSKDFPSANFAGEVLGIFSVVIWVLFILIYTYNSIRYSADFKKEYNCPIQFSFIALIPITIMLSGAILHIWWPTISQYFIWIGTISQLIFSVSKISQLLEGKEFEADFTLPTFYLPLVATNFTSASTLSLIGYHDLAYLFFGAGVISWLIYEPVLLQHLRLVAINTKLKPTLGILLAPAFVGVSAYLTINGGHVDGIAKILMGYGLLQGLFLIHLFPWIAKQGIDSRFWGFSFGLASMANASVIFYHAGVLVPLAVILFFFANIIILILFLISLVQFIKFISGLNQSRHLQIN